MSNELEVLSDDLETYFRDLRAALEKGDVKGAIKCLNDMRKEVDENLEFLTHVYVDATGKPPASE